MFCYQTTRPADIFSTFSATVHFGVPYFSISFALNALLTVMIVTRLILQRKNLRNIIGTTSGVGGLYKAAATILVESSALYAISFMLWVEAWARGSFTFSQMLGQAQVRLIFLMYHSDPCLTIRALSRSSLRSSSLYELPTGEHRPAGSSSLEISVLFVSGANRHHRVAVGPLLVTRVREMIRNSVLRLR